MEQTLNALLLPRGCALPMDLLATALTAKSGAAPTSGLSHNLRLSFLGRRVLRMHLTLFLVESRGIGEGAMTAESVERALETKELGAGVGRTWALERAMRWREVRAPNGEVSGLYKARGMALEALIGAVYLTHVSPSSAIPLSLSLLTRDPRSHRQVLLQWISPLTLAFAVDRVSNNHPISSRRWFYRISLYRQIRKRM